MQPVGKDGTKLHVGGRRLNPGERSRGRSRDSIGGLWPPYLVCAMSSALLWVAPSWVSTEQPHWDRSPTDALGGGEDTKGHLNSPPWQASLGLFAWSSLASSPA